MEKRLVLETWFDKVWCQEDMSTIDNMLVPDTTARGLSGGDKMGPAEFRDFAKALLSLIKIDRVVFDNYMESGDMAHVLLTFEATDRTASSPLSFTAQVLCKIIDDKIIYADNHADFIGLYEKLGLLPQGVMAHCLCGRSLA